MKKIFTLISMICLCAFNAMAAEVTTVTDIEKAVTDGTVVTISINGTYLYGPDAQNTKMGTAEEAVSSSNGCVGYKIEKDGDNYMFRCVTPDGGDYFIWGRTECNYLNAQPNVDGVTFNLNPGEQKGTDLANGAVWAFETVEGKLYLKNVGNGGYFAGEKTSETAVEVSVVTIKGDPEPVEEEVKILASLKSLVDNGTIFYLKTGDQYLYGSKEQECAMGTFEDATAETAAVTGWKLEYQPLGGRYIFRAITPAGENYTHGWSKMEDKTCFLNTQPALTGVTFILGKDQDAKDGSSWIIAEVEGGYTIQNKANKGYLTGLGVSDEPVVWQIVKPMPKVPEGCVDVAALTGTFADWASKVTYPKTFAVQGEAFGDGNGDKESTHVSVADYDKITFVVSQGSTQGLGLRVWMWDGSKVVTLFAHPEADEATADYTQEYLIKEPGNYVVKFNGLADLKGVKAANNWGADPIVVDLAYVTPKAVTTSINNVAVKTQDKAVKALVNGQLVIVKGNDKFNVAGQLVK